MTDKVQLIKQEIERLKEENSIGLCEYDAGYCNGVGETCSEILQFIDSIPEEPKKQPKFKVGDTIKGPCNNIFQVKEVLDTQYLLHSENRDELNSIEIVDKYSCISEEPVSEDFEEELDNFLKDLVFGKLINRNAGIVLAHHFAEWQKQQMMKNAVNCVFGSRATSAFVDDFPNIEIGDKVKIIIVKED